MAWGDTISRAQAHIQAMKALRQAQRESSLNRLNRSLEFLGGSVAEGLGRRQQQQQFEAGEAGTQGRFEAGEAGTQRRTEAGLAEQGRQFEASEGRLRTQAEAEEAARMERWRGEQPTEEERATSLALMRAQIEAYLRKPAEAETDATDPLLVRRQIMIALNEEYPRWDENPMTGEVTDAWQPAMAKLRQRYEQLVDLSRLSPQEKTALKAAFEQAVREEPSPRDDAETDVVDDGETATGGESLVDKLRRLRERGESGPSLWSVAAGQRLEDLVKFVGTTLPAQFGLRRPAPVQPPARMRSPHGGRWWRTICRAT